MHIVSTIPLITALPFILTLLIIAVMPLAFPHFWEKNRNKAILLALITLPAAVFLIFNLPHKLHESILEYFSFVVLLVSLYIVSGGIHISGDYEAKPAINSLFLFIGAVLANLIGTTGASMLLIRPLLKTNSERKFASHVPVFFIFLVSNIGGLLTPIGDPPLFLGFLKGVPFYWTLKLWPIWIVTVGLVLAVFFVIDTHFYRKESKKSIQDDKINIKSLSIQGGINFFFLTGIILSIILQMPMPFREAFMLSMAGLSMLFTSKELRKKNKFTFGPAIEIIVIFAGIFVTMVPLLEILRANSTALNITKPWQYFWITGSLSSVLDNAPTYITFFSLAQGITQNLGLTGTHIAGVSEALLKAISCGAVFMGANTYIGNGPNFMVKAIAEEQKYKMPHFFAYTAYSAIILLPIFLIVTLIFFR